MEIKTKFALGDNVWVIRNMKATEIEISAIIADENGVCFRSKGDYNAYSEDNCFATKDELIKYILDDGNESM